MSSNYLRKTACVACGSSDAFAIYDDGHGYCFSCHHYEQNVSVDSETDTQTTATTKPKQNVTSLRGEFIDIPSRRLYEKTLRKFNYSVDDKGKHYAPYYNKEGAVIAHKIRTPEKEFYVSGDLSKAGLFGQQLWSPGQRLVLTEGEVDCLSYAQVTGLTWQVCSVPNGASGALKTIRKQIHWIEQFEEVVFLFDQDEPGIKAAKDCAAILKPGLAKIAKIPLKDASEMLVAGRDSELKNAIYAAQPYRPDGVIAGEDIELSSVLQGVPKGLDLPYLELNAAIRGLRKRELVLLCAGSGIGKSTLAREIGFYLTAKHQQKVGWVMLEESLNKTVTGIVSIDQQVPLSDLLENPDLVSRERWEQSYNDHVTKCVFNTEWGCQDIDELVGKLRYFAVGAECDFIIFDHIHLAISGLKDHDERKAIDNLMTNLRLFVEQTGVGLITVAHLRRNNNKDSFNDGGTVSLTDLRGSSALEQLADVVIASERNQQGNESDVTQLRLLKNRPYGVVGPAGKLHYCTHRGRLLHYDDTFSPDDPVGDIPF